ncbi:MAG TPA: HPr family phosphocarrier protein [Rhodanobacteraceae bacterium]
MLETTVTVSNRLGLHARAAAKLVQAVQPLEAQVMLVSGTREVNAKSIMGVMMLAAGLGTPLTVRADGPDENRAITTVTDLFERKFDEGG